MKNINTNSRVSFNIVQDRGRVADLLFLQTLFFLNSIFKEKVTLGVQDYKVFDGVECNLLAFNSQISSNDTGSLTKFEDNFNVGKGKQVYYLKVNHILNNYDSKQIVAKLCYGCSIASIVWHKLFFNKNLKFLLKKKRFCNFPKKRKIFFYYRNKKNESLLLSEYCLFFLKASLSRKFIVPLNSYFIFEFCSGVMYNLWNFLIFSNNKWWLYIHKLGVDLIWVFWSRIGNFSTLSPYWLEDSYYFVNYLYTPKYSNSSLKYDYPFFLLSVQSEETFLYLFAKEVIFVVSNLLFFDNLLLFSFNLKFKLGNDFNILQFYLNNWKFFYIPFLKKFRTKLLLRADQTSFNFRSIKFDSSGIFREHPNYRHDRCISIDVFFIYLLVFNRVWNLRFFNTGSHLMKIKLDFKYSNLNLFSLPENVSTYNFIDDDDELSFNTNFLFIFFDFIAVAFKYVSDFVSFLSRSIKSVFTLNNFFFHVSNKFYFFIYHLNLNLEIKFITKSLSSYSKSSLLILYYLKSCLMLDKFFTICDEIVVGDYYSGTDQYYGLFSKKVFENYYLSNNFQKPLLLTLIIAYKIFCKMSYFLCFFFKNCFLVLVLMMKNTKKSYIISFREFFFRYIYVGIKKLVIVVNRGCQLASYFFKVPLFLVSFFNVQKYYLFTINSKVYYLFFNFFKNVCIFFNYFYFKIVKNLRIYLYFLSYKKLFFYFKQVRFWLLVVYLSLAYVFNAIGFNSILNLFTRKVRIFHVCTFLIAFFILVFVFFEYVVIFLCKISFVFLLLIIMAVIPYKINYLSNVSSLSLTSKLKLPHNLFNLFTLISRIFLAINIHKLLSIFVEFRLFFVVFLLLYWVYRNIIGLVMYALGGVYFFFENMANTVRKYAGRGFFVKKGYYKLNVVDFFLFNVVFFLKILVGFFFNKFENSFKFLKLFIWSFRFFNLSDFLWAYRSLLLLLYGNVGWWIDCTKNVTVKNFYQLVAYNSVNSFALVNTFLLPNSYVSIKMLKNIKFFIDNLNLFFELFVKRFNLPLKDFLDEFVMKYKFNYFFKFEKLLFFDDVLIDYYLLGFFKKNKFIFFDQSIVLLANKTIDWSKKINLGRANRVIGLMRSIVRFFVRIIAIIVLFFLIILCIFFWICILQLRVFFCCFSPIITNVFFVLRTLFCALCLVALFWIFVKSCYVLFQVTLINICFFIFLIVYFFIKFFLIYWLKK